MPLYNRKCMDCKHLEEERLENINSAEVIECPICHKTTFIKTIVQSGFKIEGYSYLNGYSNNS